MSCEGIWGAGSEPDVFFRVAVARGNLGIRLTGKGLASGQQSPEAVSGALAGSGRRPGVLYVNRLPERYHNLSLRPAGWLGTMFNHGIPNQQPPDSRRRGEARTTAHVGWTVFLSLGIGWSAEVNLWWAQIQGYAVAGLGRVPRDLEIAPRLSCFGEGAGAGRDASLMTRCGSLHRVRIEESSVLSANDELGQSGESSLWNDGRDWVTSSHASARFSPTIVHTGQP